MTWDHEGLDVADPAQFVLESEPYRQLVYTWQTMTPELARRFGLSDELHANMSQERQSRVAVDIEPIGQMVKLTIVHDNLDPGSARLEFISRESRS